MKWLSAIAICLVMAGNSDAATITFNFGSASTSVSATKVFLDTTSMFSITAQGVDFSTQTVSSSYQIHQNGFGIGIDTSALNPADGEASGFVDNQHNAERLELSLGSNSFQLVGLSLVFPKVASGANTTGEYYVYANGPSDFSFVTYSGAGNVTPSALQATTGSFAFTGLPFSSTWDFITANYFANETGAGGYKILSATFETGRPLPTPVPEPVTVGVMLAGLAVILRLRQRASKK
jgi:hypothetical protein